MQSNSRIHGKDGKGMETTRKTTRRHHSDVAKARLVAGTVRVPKRQKPGAAGMGSPRPGNTSVLVSNKLTMDDSSSKGMRSMSSMTTQRPDTTAYTESRHKHKHK